MHSLLRASLVATIVLVISRGSQAQGPAIAPTPESAHSPAEEQMDLLQKNVETLQAQLSATQVANPQDEKLRKQVEILQKQIETQQKMIQLLIDQMKEQPAAGPPGPNLQTQVTTLQSRSVQAANRDQELSQAIDNINEHNDAVERNGPRLPAPLKELFFPSGTNQTPLSIYTNFNFGYNQPESQPSGFFFGTFAPHLRMELNDWILMVGEIDVGSNGSVAVTDAEMDFFVNDWLTVVAGIFPAPIGFWNERLNSPWINRLPDQPLMWRQVSPAMSLLGVGARGGFYLGCSPIKLEYNAWVSNGLNVTPATPPTPTPNELANLEGMENTFNINSNERAFGGRLGFWIPEIGLNGGISGLGSGDYVTGFEDAIALWGVDLGYHKGNWDARFEYASVYQQAKSFQDTNIRRQGLYAQVSYRPYKAPCKYLANTEVVARYSYTRFSGIDPTALDLTAFSDPRDIPVTRHQTAFGINYWFYPSMVLQVAYEINHEPGFPLHDNFFMTQLGLGF
jgi:hypothetical protein